MMRVLKLPRVVLQCIELCHSLKTRSRKTQSYPTTMPAGRRKVRNKSRLTWPSWWRTRDSQISKSFARARNLNVTRASSLSGKYTPFPLTGQSSYRGPPSEFVIRTIWSLIPVIRTRPDNGDKTELKEAVSVIKVLVIRTGVRLTRTGQFLVQLISMINVHGFYSYVLSPRYPDRSPFNEDWAVFVQ